MEQIRNAIWTVSDDGGKTAITTQHAVLAVLMDIRNEMQILNRVLACPNFQAIPTSLRRIARNTAKRRKPKGR